MVSEQTSESMRYLMRSNATHGSASFANIPGYYVGGKTGTADKIIHGHYSQDKVFTTFMAITPADKPKYLYMMIYDEPQAAPEDTAYHTAAHNAGRVAGALIRRVEPLEGVPPTKDPPISRSPSSPDWGMDPTPTRWARSESRGDETAWRHPRSQGRRSRAASRAVAGLASTAARPRRAMSSSRSPAPRTTASPTSARRLAKGAAAIVAERAPRVSERRLRQRRRRARGAGARRGAALPAPARDDRRGHRHQRKDLGRRLRAADLEALGLEAASLGTIGVVSRPLNVYGSLTTPDPIALHSPSTGLPRAASPIWRIEASSHGLDQKRLDGVRLAAGAFTNLSRDHMDYHATVEDYLAAKLRLFRDLLPEGAPAVIDADSDIAPRVIAAARARGPRGVHGRREGRDDPARLGRARSVLVDARPRVRRAPDGA